MHISLVKGQKADVTKTNPGLTQIGIGLGWNAPANLDLDTSAFFLGEDKKQFSVQFSGVPAHVEMVAITLTIHEGEKLKQQFSQVNQAYIRIFHPSSGQDMLRYELGNHFSI